MALFGLDRNAVRAEARDAARRDGRRGGGAPAGGDAFNADTRVLYANATGLDALHPGMVVMPGDASLDGPATIVDAKYPDRDGAPFGVVANDRHLTLSGIAVVAVDIQREDDEYAESVQGVAASLRSTANGGYGRILSKTKSGAGLMFCLVEFPYAGGEGATPPFRGDLSFERVTCPDDDTAPVDAPRNAEAGVLVLTVMRRDGEEWVRHEDYRPSGQGVSLALHCPAQEVRFAIEATGGHTIPGTASPAQQAYDDACQAWIDGGKQGDPPTKPDVDHGPRNAWHFGRARFDWMVSADGDERITGGNWIVLDEHTSPGVYNDADCFRLDPGPTTAWYCVTTGGRSEVLRLTECEAEQLRQQGSSVSNPYDTYDEANAQCGTKYYCVRNANDDGFDCIASVGPPTEGYESGPFDSCDQASCSTLDPSGDCPERIKLDYLAEYRDANGNTISSIRMNGVVRYGGMDDTPGCDPVTLEYRFENFYLSARMGIYFACDTSLGVVMYWVYWDPTMQPYGNTWNDGGIDFMFQSHTGAYFYLPSHYGEAAGSISQGSWRPSFCGKTYENITLYNRYSVSPA